MTIAAVTFDFWNTLCRADVEATAARRRAAWVAVLETRPLPIDPSVVHAVLDHVTEKHHHGWTTNSQYTAEHAVEEAVALLGEMVGVDARDELWDAWLGASRRADIELTPHLPETLAALDDAGIRIGIVCDVGLTPSLVLLEFLERHGVLRHFDHWSFSDEVGVYKPDQRIFVHAREGLGIADPAAMAHIGDLRRTDVAGAREAGWRSLRYTGFADDPSELPDADHVVSHHLELVELLTA